MKKIVVGVCVLFVLFLVGVGLLNQPQKQEYIRIHIRANSNLEIDQNVKYQIKDEVVEFLTPQIVYCENKQDFFDVIEYNLKDIEEIANNILKQKGFSYVSKASLCQEDFPTRSYNGFVLESGIYDALILSLGEAKGDNWWCVVYPPLCFIESANQNVLYKSKILEILELIKK
ncbi:MAG: stage II sporulation protein R [Clostridia bacterium]|nr:stage II sporulation protein R [Clostridia bacterium]